MTYKWQGLGSRDGGTNTPSKNSSDSRTPSAASDDFTVPTRTSPTRGANTSMRKVTSVNAEPSPGKMRDVPIDSMSKQQMHSPTPGTTLFAYSRSISAASTSPMSSPNFDGAMATVSRNTDKMNMAN